MLVKFSFKNFKTFREEAELTLVASTDTTRQTENVIDNLPFNFSLLKSAVVYGANASGKSKMMEALGFMRRFILNSSKETQKGDRIGVEPFLLSTETLERPSLFEIIFLFQKVMYRYGFEADNHHITSEWLYYRPKTKEIELFYREGQEFDVHARLFTKGVSLAKDKMIRDNALMLSVAAQFNDKIAGKVVEWFIGLRI
jgi:AAA15 family ATPase/GTPase